MKQVLMLGLAAAIGFAACGPRDRNDNDKDATKDGGGSKFQGSWILESQLQAGQEAPEIIVVEKDGDVIFANDDQHTPAGKVSSNGKITSAKKEDESVTLKLVDKNILVATLKGDEKDKDLEVKYRRADKNVIDECAKDPSEGEHAYRQCYILPDSSCSGGTTGKHIFYEHTAYCAGLLNDGMNKNCARKAREELHNKDCKAQAQSK